MNIVLPASAAAVCGVAPLAVYGAEQAYLASHFDATYDAESIILSNPEVIEHHDYHTKITAVEPNMVVYSLDLYIGSKFIDPLDYGFNPETGDLSVYGELIDCKTLIILAHLVPEANIEFADPGQEVVETYNNEGLVWYFRYTSDILPETNRVNFSIEKKAGEGQLVPLYPEEMVPVFWDDDYASYIIAIELKFEPRPEVETYEEFKIYFHFVSGTTGKPIDIELDDGYRAEFKVI